eukprot:747862-Hanusia_phi.AAC.9
MDKLQREYAQKQKELGEEEKKINARVKAANERLVVVDSGDQGDDPEPVNDSAPVLPPSSADTAGLSNGTEEGVPSDAPPAAEEAQDDEYSVKHAAWKQRRQERGGDQADKEKGDAQREEKKFHERVSKYEMEHAHKVERASVYYAPIGMDRHRNKYWWFPSDKHCLYIEPPPPSSAQEPPMSPRSEQDIKGINSPARNPVEWRMWVGGDVIGSILDKLYDKGVRESELKKSLLKVRDKMGPGGVTQTVVFDNLGDTGSSQLGALAAETEAFAAAHQEAKNVAEIMDQEQLRLLKEEMEDWEAMLQEPGECSNLARLLLAMEDAIFTSHAPVKKSRQATVQMQTNQDMQASEAMATEAADVENGQGALPEWSKDNEFVGKRVRRNVKGDDGKPAGQANGTVIGFLPKEISDFVSKDTNQPAALWRISFDDEDIGEEDLEEFEIVNAIQAYEKLQADLRLSFAAIARSRGSTSKELAGGEHGSNGTEQELQNEGSHHKISSAVAGSDLQIYEEGAVDMAEANNKPSRRSLWTRCESRRQRKRG